MHLKPILFYVLVIGWIALLASTALGPLIFIDLDSLSRNPYLVPLEFAASGCSLVAGIILIASGGYMYRKEALVFVAIGIVFLSYAIYVNVEYGADDAANLLGQPIGPSPVGN